MIIKLTEQQLNNILASSKPFVNETLGKTYKGDLYNALGKEWQPNRVHNSFFEKVEQLGFKHILTKSEYDGEYTESVRKYKTTLENYNKTRRQLQSLLNFYGYSIISEEEGVSDENGQEMKWLTFEANYNEDFDYSNNPIFYHAAPTQSVNKILRQGLVPKDRNKLGLSRPNRVYLLRNYDDHYFRELSRKEGQFIGKDWDYTVLKIDLSGMENNVHLYQDPYSENGKAFYTSDNIPSSCITVPMQRKQVILKNREFVMNTLNRLYPFLNVEASTSNPSILSVKGTYENPSTSIVSQFGFQIQVENDDTANDIVCQLIGKKIRQFPSGRTTIKPIGKNEFNGLIVRGKDELTLLFKNFIGSEMKQKRATKQSKKETI